VILVNRKLNVGNYKNLVSTRARGRFQRVVRLAFFYREMPATHRSA